MKRSSTLFLKATIALMGIAALTLCIFALPSGIQNSQWGGYRPIFIAMYISAIPFFIALSQALNLLHFIDRNKIFSDLSIKALQKIKYSAIVITTIYTLGLPYIYRVAQQDDAPGVMLIGLVFAFAPCMIAILAAVLQNILQNAIGIKSENDLII
jgi:hypothetical protein